MDFDWFAKNPLNNYECFWCGQHYKCNCNPENVIGEECFRCKIGYWEIKEGTRLTPSFETWEQRIEWSEKTNEDVSS